MSKVDAMRALREAKHSRGGAPPEPPGPRRAGTGTPTVGAGAPVRPTTPRPTASRPSSTTADVAAPADAVADELCGHRNMGGKSCSRPAGHSEKNHRYR